MKKDLYHSRKRCKNCLVIDIVEVPFGKTLSQYFKDNPKCKNCGCDIDKFE